MHLKKLILWLFICVKVISSSLLCERNYQYDKDNIVHLPDFMQNLSLTFFCLAVRICRGAKQIIIIKNIAKGCELWGDVGSYRLQMQATAPNRARLNTADEYDAKIVLLGDTGTHGRFICSRFLLFASCICLMRFSRRGQDLPRCAVRAGVLLNKKPADNWCRVPHKASVRSISTSLWCCRR